VVSPRFSSSAISLQTPFLSPLKEKLETSRRTNEMTILWTQHKDAALNEVQPAPPSSPDSLPEAGRYGTGIIKWSGGINNQTGKVNDFGFIQTKSGDVFFHKANVVSSWESLRDSARVMFRFVNGRHGKIAASEVGKLDEIPDEALLKYLTASEGSTGASSRTDVEEGLTEIVRASDGMLGWEALRRLVSSASELTLATLAGSISANDALESRANWLSALDRRTLLRHEATALRVMLPRHHHLATLALLPSLDGYNQEAISALQKQRADSTTDSSFWARFPPRGPKDAFFQYAPDRVKTNVCRNHYAAFLRRLDDLFDPLEDAQTRLDAVATCNALTEEDRELAEAWAKDKSKESTLARMLSARAAEKAAISFYRGQGCVVEDVAIHQLSPGLRDWITHDLRIDRTVAIDVKNSRRPRNSKRFYVEHTVPKFKLDRQSRNVHIAGVLSPYLRLGFLEKPETAAFEIEPIVFLGETRFDDVERLVQSFDTPTFVLDRGRHRTVPTWLFDYPAAWYKNYLTNVAALTGDCAWPEGDEWRYTLYAGEIDDALIKLCAIGVNPPDALVRGRDDWEKAFHAKLRDDLKTLPRLPTIYLTVIKDFVGRLRGAPSDFSPTDYVPLLFVSGKEHAESYPMGVLDPLCIVKNLIDTIALLWSNRESLKLDKLVTFRFTGLGILQGKEFDASKWITILAYCGGSVYEMDGDKVRLDSDGRPTFQSKCGYAPLILGVQNTCGTCGYLVCSQCEFCCRTCEEARFERQARAELEECVGARSGRAQGHGRARPGWDFYREPENDKHARSSDMPPAWDIPIEAYKDGY
jgi:cold shock CspA family protein